MSEYLKRLKELRLTKGISQKEIAEYYNVSLDDLLEMNGTPTLPAVCFVGSGFTEEEMKEILQFAEFKKVNVPRNLWWNTLSDRITVMVE